MVPVPSNSRRSAKRLRAVPSVAVAGNSQRPQASAQVGSNRSSTVRRLPTKPALPIWLRLLMRVQQLSAIAALGSGIAVAGVYCSTVYIQQLWGQQYRTFERLERNQRQMTTVGEVLKDQMAQQAEQPDSGMTPLNPERMIFVNPSQSAQPAASSPPTPTPAASPTKPSSLPLGY